MIALQKKYESIFAAHLYRVIEPSVDKYLMKYKYINRRKMKSNFQENIKIDQGNKINIYFLIHPPSTPTIRQEPVFTRHARFLPKFHPNKSPIHAPEPRHPGNRKSRIYSPECSKWRSPKSLNLERKEATISSAKTLPYFLPFLDKIGGMGWGSVLLEGNSTSSNAVCTESTNPCPNSSRHTR